MGNNPLEKKQIPFSAPETTHAWREPSLSRLMSPRMENWKHLGFSEKFTRRLGMENFVKVPG